MAEPSAPQPSSDKPGQAAQAQTQPKAQAQPQAQAQAKPPGGATPAAKGQTSSASAAKSSATARAKAPAAAKAKSASTGRSAPSGAAEGPIEAIKADHRRVEALFGQFEKADDRQKTQLCRQICAELVIHTMIEEEIFYPECRRRAGQDEQAEEKLDEAQIEHDSAKILVGDLFDGGENDPLRDAKVQVLAEQIRHHVKEEEQPGQGILAKAKALGLDTPELAQRLQQRKQALQAEAQSGRLRPPPPSAIKSPARSQGRQNQEESMPRERDERGRFMSEDDRDYGRGGRGRYEDDDRDYRSRGRGQGGWFGDPEGHSRASREGWDERRGEDRSYRGRGRDDEDDDRSRGARRGGEVRHERAMEARRGGDRTEDRGQGGWFGDPEGHSRAAREAWDEHRDSYMRSRDERGWFGDPEGHSRASREGWGERGGEERSYRSRGRDDDDDRGGRSGGRGQGGWFGDSEGHSRAAREGWDERRGDDRYRSRGRDDDDDDRGGRSRGRGQGGWFGDPEGHSEASRRGWDRR